MNKKTLFIITANTTAKVGMLSYLSSIFHNYLTLVSIRASDVTPQQLSTAHCILYTTEDVRGMLHERIHIHDTIHELVCTRTFNHTYLNKILQIPLGSFVYVVNDFESSTYGVIQLLREFGFSQYHFLPYYPGCGPINPDVHYALTPGETHLVPPGIPHVINIGIRVPDVSTIHAIITHFHLPENLADEITRNYINHIVQTLKISHRQLSQAIDTKNMTQTIINNITNGVCLTDQDYNILMANPAFLQVLGIPHHNPLNDNLKLLLQDHNLSCNLSSSKEYHFFNTHNEPIRLWVQEVDSLSQSHLLLVHVDLCNLEEANIQPLPLSNESPLTPSFTNTITNDPSMLRVLRIAKRLSLTDYPILLQGGSSFEREILARSIHNNSRRQTAPFLIFSPSSVQEEDLIAQLSGYFRQDTLTGTSILENGILSLANHGTLFIEGVDKMSRPMQEFFLQTIQKNSILPKGGTEDIPINFRLIVSSGTDLYELVQAHSFSQELFFALCGSTLEIPPLCNRPKDITTYMEFFQKKYFSHVAGHMKKIFTTPLLSFLETYSWPGNYTEIQNLFQYFSCIYEGNPLELDQLPPYLLRQVFQNEQKLSLQENWVLSIIQAHPRIGRTSIQKYLLQQGHELSEGKIRSILQTLSTHNYIRIHRTKGGCEITSLGQMVLRSNPFVSLCTT